MNQIDNVQYFLLQLRSRNRDCAADAKETMHEAGMAGLKSDCRALAAG
jgi:hypothetical protein